MASEPPLILVFDTASSRCAAAVVRGGTALASRDEPMDRGQAERLMPLLEAVLAEAGVSWTDLSGLAVCTGPGNFTGLRIAVAAARGLALALGIPAVGVSAFEVLAPETGAGTVVIEDRRGAIFAQSFQDGLPEGPPAACADPDPVPEAALRPDLLRLAVLAAARLGTAPLPSPLYLRPADANPPSEMPPTILDAR